MDSSNAYVAAELSIVQTTLLPNGAATVMAHTQQAYCIAQDASNVYWLDSGSAGAGLVMEIPKVGGVAVTLAANQPLLGVLSPGNKVLVDSANVYWLTDAAAVIMAPKNRGAMPPLTTLVANAIGFAVDSATTLYWGDKSAGTIMKVSIGGGGKPAIVASGQTPTGPIVVDSVAVYWAGSAGIMAAAK